MSVMIISEQRFSEVANWILKNKYNFQHLHIPALRSCKHGDLNNYFRYLQLLNTRNFNKCYSSEHIGKPTQIYSKQEITGIEAYKTMQCIHYNCTDYYAHNDYVKKLGDFMQALGLWLLEQSDEYEQADWG